MDAVASLREQFKHQHGILEGTMQDVTADQAQWSPPGRANPLGASYAHTVLGEDVMVNGLVKGGAPMFVTSWAGKAGVSEPPPMPDQGDWDAWARKVNVDLGALRQYAQAVYQNTDEYLASLDGSGLDRDIDLSAFHLGKQTVGWFLSNMLVPHVANHCGEIACLKGIQDAKGYPF